MAGEGGSAPMSRRQAADRPAGHGVTLFDLDGVLTRRDTMATLVRERLLQHPARLTIALPLVVLSRVCPAMGRARPAVHRTLVRLALRGMSRDTYEALARAIARTLATRPGNAPAGALQSLRAAAATGGVIVVTASEDTLARAYLDELGLPRVHVLASRMQGWPVRPRLAPHNVGPAKVEALRRTGLEISTAHLYTDSVSDLPLAWCAAETTLVNPSRRLHRTFSRRVPRVHIVRW